MSVRRFPAGNPLRRGAGALLLMVSVGALSARHHNRSTVMVATLAGQAALVLFYFSLKGKRDAKRATPVYVSSPPRRIADSQRPADRAPVEAR